MGPWWDSLRSRRMRCETAALQGQTFDFLVIGGGIQGAAIARELALRGSSVLLVEREDFAGGTSMRSSRLVHGGVRYLQQGHISLVREALGERERLLRLAPHLVRPVPMLMPFFEDSGGRSPWLVKLGLRAYSWLARRSRLPRPESFDAASCLRLFPGLRQRGLRGGALFWDGRTEDLRLTLAVLEGAAAAGAKLANHVELVGVGVRGYRLLDRITACELEVSAREVINASGPRVDAVRRVLDLEGDELVRVSRGSHLVLPARNFETALAAFLPDGRIQFLIPHRDGTICGTTELEEATVDAAEPTVPLADVDYLLGATGFLLEDPPDRDSVQFAYCGYRALPARRGPAGALNREAFTVAERSASGPVHSVVGGKLTTHRAFAERLVARLLGARSASPTRDLHLPGGDGPQEVADPLWWRHGSRAAAIRALAKSSPDWLAPIAPDRDILMVEAVYALRRQAAVTFTDLALRRLFDTRGPVLDEASLRALHAVYLAERPIPLESSFEQDRDDLYAAVAAMTGAAGETTGRDTEITDV